nr:hypothetical protein [Tanacetum cinerariifolium]
TGSGNLYCQWELSPGSGNALCILFLTSYRGMIGSLMYLTATRPHIQFSTVLCARYQSNLKESHLIAVKRILRRDSMSPSPLVAKPKKGKSQTITLTSPKSQGLKDSRALSKKIKRPMDITFTTPDEGTAKTTSCPKGSHGDKDSGGNKPPADLEPQNLTDVDLSGTGEPDTRPMLLTYADVRAILLFENEAQESEEDILGADEETNDIPQKYDDTLPLTKRQLVKYLRKVSRVLFERITKDQWENHKEADVHYVNLKAFIDDYYNKTLLTMIRLINCVTLTFALTDTPTNVKGENATHTATKEPSSHTEGETNANIQNKPEEPKHNLSQSSILNRLYHKEGAKVIHEEEKKFGIHPKEAITTKAGELFKKAQEDEHEVLKRQHTEKSALPAPEQAPSQTSGRKQKHIGLKPETRIPGLECNRTLHENVLFVKNTIIEEPEYGIFFTNKLGDQAFQRWSDIDKVRMEALVSYLVAATMVKSHENARFSMKLRKLIAEHLD